MIKRYFSVLMLACTTLLAPALIAHRRAITKELSGIKTPGGTAFVRDSKGNWSHPEFKAGGLREGHVFKLDFDKDSTMGLPTLKDDTGNGVSLAVTYDQTEIDLDSPQETAKRYFREYIGENGTWKSRLCVSGVALGVGMVLYKNSDTVRDAVDQALEKTGDFVSDFKEGKGNARSNTFVALGAATALGIGIHRYMTGSWILQS